MEDGLRTELLRALIVEQRAQTQDQIAALTRSFDDIVEAVAVTNNDDEHDPEGTTIAFERAQVSALLSQAKADLEALDEAIDRMADGEYGICVVCSAPIAAERLRAIPSTVRCIRCA